MALFPISFCIPEEKIININNIDDYDKYKSRLFSIYNPGERYIFEEEEQYYEQYKIAYFGRTWKKGGWDCMRHYEILANGCIPWFPDLDKCPLNTMTHFPKDIVAEIMEKYKHINHTNNVNQLTLIEKEELFSYSKKLLEYTKNHLTTKKMASYILNKTNNTDAKRILFLSGQTTPDYLRCLLLHGFKSLFGSECHDFPKINHIYKIGLEKKKQLYGKGFSYTDLLNHNNHNNTYDSDIIDLINKKYFDIVIFGSIHRMKNSELIESIYEKNRLIYLCGEDFHNGSLNCPRVNNIVQNGSYIFVREIY